MRLNLQRAILAGVFFVIVAGGSACFADHGGHGHSGGHVSGGHGHSGGHISGGHGHSGGHAIGGHGYSSGRIGGGHGYTGGHISGGHGYSGGHFSGNHGLANYGRYGGHNSFSNWGGRNYYNNFGHHNYSGYRPLNYYRSYYYRPYAYRSFGYPYVASFFGYPYRYYNYPYTYSNPGYNYYDSCLPDDYTNGGDYLGNVYSNALAPNNYVVSRPAADVAQLEIRLPDPQATIWVEGQEITSDGTVRQFKSPQLDPSRQFAYRVKASWNNDGQLVTDERRVEVHANAQSIVDFTKPNPSAPEAGRLPPPQPLPPQQAT